MKGVFLAHGDHEKHHGPGHPAGTAQTAGQGAGKRH
nr:MAG TPA_asm: Polypeptide N-acetylgalactosaminyltransferase 10 [Caudoviricetes sp.]